MLINLVLVLNGKYHFQNKMNTRIDCVLNKRTVLDGNQNQKINVLLWDALRFAIIFQISINLFHIEYGQKIKFKNKIKK